MNQTEHFAPITYKARVVKVLKDENAVKIVFIYFGSYRKNRHFDVITEQSSRYDKALKIRAGDEVYADPIDYNKIYRFHFNNVWRRSYLRIFEPLF